MIETVLSIFRFMAFVVIFLHAVRTIRNTLLLEGTLLEKTKKHFSIYFQDVAIVLFFPVYAYMAFFSSGTYTPAFEKLMGIPLAIYIGAPLVREVFFAKSIPRSAPSTRMQTHKV